MKEGALKWALRLLGLVLIIGPILIAFGINNWDIKATVLPSDAELNQLRDQVTGIFSGGFSQDTITWGNPTFVGNDIRVPVTFKSPLKIPIKITGFSVTVSDQGVQIAQLHMEESEVEIPANGTVDFTLVGSYVGAVPVNPQFAGVIAAFEFYGLTAQVNWEAT